MARLRSSKNVLRVIHTAARGRESVQCWAKEWSLGCVNSPPAARGSQEAVFTRQWTTILGEFQIEKGILK